MPSYRILLHIILSIITHENTSDTYGFYFIFDTKTPSVATTLSPVLPYQMFLRIPFVNHT